jgi:hypothetical protein
MREMAHRTPQIIFHPTNVASSPVPRDINNINNDFPTTAASYDDFFDQTRNRENTNQRTFMKGGFRVHVSFFECARYLATRKILLKLLRIEMETNHIIMTMRTHYQRAYWTSFFKKSDHVCLLLRESLYTQKLP